ncbi:MAG: ATP-binding cassette domain-containing protein [Egibacteraceae bacterium]
MNEPAVATRGLSVSFGGVHAVRAVDLSVAAGERRVIIGPNGAGKTTLSNLIGGQVRPDVGTVQLHGRDVTDRSVHQRARAGLARTFQITNLLPQLSVLDNVLLAVAARRRRTRWTVWRRLHRIEAVAALADELLERWDLARLRHQRVAALGYGQQRLLEIVMAFAAEPGCCSSTSRPPAWPAPTPRRWPTSSATCLPRSRSS